MGASREAPFLFSGDVMHRTSIVGLLFLAAFSAGPAAEPERAGNIELATAARYFQEFQALCAADDGKLWGVSFCGPILLVDPPTHMAVATRADTGEVLRPRGGVYAGQIPETVGLANTAVNWGGTRWTMIMWWSLSSDRARRLALMAHESFHRIQPELDLTPFGEINAHLDGADGRFWMQLEWDALQKALLSEGETRLSAVADAIAFRAARHTAFARAAEREIPLEIFEGLAEYSGMRLAGFSDERVVESVSDRRKNETGFVRSFAYVSGPLYGFLLDGAGVDWRTRVTGETDLGALLKEALELEDSAAGDALSRAASYGGVALRATEQQRAREREARLARWRAALVEGPVLVLDLNAVSSGTFDPREVFPFVEGQTVYTQRGLIAEWGKLTVTDGAILEDDKHGRAHVSLRGAADDRTEGPGWTLELNEGWRIVPAERPGDSTLRRGPDLSPSPPRE